MQRYPTDEHQRGQHEDSPRETRHLRLVLTLLLALQTLALPGAAIAAICPDVDADGYVVCSGGCDPDGKLCGDCDDNAPGINPGATEMCNGFDDNCNGSVDGDDPGFPPFDDVEVSGIPDDDDGDGSADEGYGFCVFNESSGPDGTCKTGGILVCQVPPGPVTYVPAPGDPFGLTGRGVFTCENAASNIVEYAEESLAAGTCDDGVDNDCDGSIDLAELACREPEKCDGQDNDGDGQIDNGFNVGAACSAGNGICLRNGVLVCNADGTATLCSATPGTANDEGTIFGSSCENNKDDDCDLLTDLADPDCAGFGDPELCGNGSDDDGDGVIDEGYPTVGVQCAEGIGACRQIGAIQCSADRLDTECGAVATAPPEPGVELTCNDVIDNDCDGFADAADVDCAGALADLGVTCSLPYRVGRRPADCLATHYIQFDGGQATDVRADLVSVDENGDLLAMIENVQNGDVAYLGSRTNPIFWRIFSSPPSPVGSYHTMFHKNPMLRVVGRKGDVEDVAYCGIVPFIDVTGPNGQTLSLPDDDSVELTAYLPLIDVDTLKIELDGIDILEALGINDSGSDLPSPGGNFCTAPGDCVFQVQAGCGVNSLVDVAVERLAVEGLDPVLAPTTNDGVAAPNQINTLHLKISGLPAGGHLFRIAAQPLPRTPLNRNCFRDDLTDTGRASAFGITVDSPDDQEIVVSAPVTVAGIACGGKEIAALAINGEPVDVAIPASQTCTGDDINTARECAVAFNEQIPERSLVAAAEGTAPSGSFLRGSNRVIVDGTDNDGFRAFNTDVVFALGQVQQPLGLEILELQNTAKTTYDLLLQSDEQLAQSPVADKLEGNLPQRVQQFIEEDIGPQIRDTLWNLQSFLEEEIARAMAAATLDTAFLVGLDEGTAQSFFNNTCEQAIDTFTADLSANLSGETFGRFDVKPDCSCDLNDIPLELRSLTFTTWAAENPNGPPTCEVDFTPGKIGLNVHLPKTHLKVGAKRSCTTHGLFGECIARTKVDVVAEVSLVDVAFDVTITESQIETKTPNKDAFAFTYRIVDPDGTNLYAQAGTCTNPSGEECFSDSSCWPLELPGAAGTCAKGANEGVACTSDNSCPPDPSGLGNKCTGGENQGKSCETNADCPGGACFAKCVGTCNGVVKNDKDSGFDPVTQNDVGIECWGASICLVFDTVARAIGGAFAFVFTLGDFDIGNFIFQQFGVGGFEFEKSFLDDLQLGEPDAMGLGDIGVDPEAFSEDSKNSAFTPGPINVDIADNALIVSFGAEFASQCDDPVIDETPGAALTPARVPTPAEVSAVGSDVSMLIADDVFNQVFASMKECGQLQSFCTSAGEDLDTVGDILPDDCSTLPLPSLRGECYAIRGIDCTTLSGATERGVCHGFKGDDCLTLPVDDLNILNKQIVRNNCEQTEPRNISQDDTILLCGQVDMDPELGVKDEDASDKFVGVDIALKQVSVLFVLDRANDNYTGDLADLRGCLSTEGDAAPDCELYAACLDLAVSTEMGIDNSVCPANSLGFTPKVLGVVPSNTNFGVMCNASGASDDQGILESAFESVVIDKISENAEKFAPPFCIDGLSLNGVVDIDLEDAKLFGITTDGVTPGYADYLGVTVGLEAP